MDGRFSIDDAAELGWPIEDSDAYETIAGFILDLADGLPSPGEVFEVEGWRFRVQSMRGNRIALLRVIAPVPHDPEQEEADEDSERSHERDGGWLSRIREGHDDKDAPVDVDVEDATVDEQEKR